MSTERTYKNIIFTKHAWERKKQRSISDEAVFLTLKYPDRVKEDSDSATFIKKVYNRTVHAVAEYLPKEKKWLIISVWVRGEDDKLPLQWQVIIFPFKLVWWLLKLIFKLLHTGYVYLKNYKKY